MLVGGWDPFRDMERRRGWVNQNAENSGRLAHAYAVFETTGWGEAAFEDCFEFRLTFVEVPVVSYGSRIISASNLPVDNEDDVLVDTRFPRCSGMVYQYKQDNRGFFTGAWCLATVDTRSPYVPTTVTEDPGYAIEHWFTFSGIALKDLPAEAMARVDI